MGLEAAKIAKFRVVMLSGSEETLRRDELRTILAAVTTTETDVETIVADARPPTQWTASAASAPFLADRRIVVVRNVLRVNPAEEWQAKPKSGDHPFVQELAALPDTALLILVADDESGDEEKQGRLQTVSRRWAEIVVAAKGHVSESKADQRAIAEEVRKIAKERGKHMTPSTATLLTEMTGGSLTLAVSELEKVILYSGKSDSIHDSDVRSAVAPELDYNVYQLVDAIAAGDSGTALGQVRTLTSSNDKIEGQVFSRILPTIAKHFRIIWQARLCLDADCRASDPSPAVVAMLPSKPRIDQERDWKQRQAMQTARRLGLRQIRRVFAELADADARLKGLLPSSSPTETIEEMVLKMAAACRKD